jgi:putative redox protein
VACYGLSNTMEARPPTVIDLSWQGGLRFEARAREQTLTVDGDGAAGISPVQALVVALAGCMASDVAHILTKGRLPFEALTAHLEAERAPTDPRRVVRVALSFAVKGAVPPEKVERAIALSRETYCSVWHSLRQDINFVTTFEVTP